MNARTQISRISRSLLVLPAAFFMLTGCRTTDQGGTQPKPAPDPVTVNKPAPKPTPVPPKPAPAMAAQYVKNTDLAPSRLRSMGSDTMDNLMEYWGEAFRKHQPKVRVYHEGKGSGTATPALVEGRSDLGPMSRALKEAEIADFKAKYGYEPTQCRVAIDALAVYVHPSNPIARMGLDFEQLDAIFSKSRLRGHKEDIVTWGQLGLSGEWANAPIKLYSRNSASGTYGFFKNTVMTKKGEYKDNKTQLAGSSLLVNAVAKDKYGIGYSGIGYKTDAVATVALSAKPGEKKYPAESEYAYSGQYPLARFLYLTVACKPGTQVAALQGEFMRFVYSREGQEIVKRDGFFPVSAKIRAEDLGKLGVK